MLLVLAAALVCVIELDGVYVGQLLVSRPIFLGPLLGLMFHQAELGAGLGALTEMFTLESLPVGTATVPNGSVAGATALLLALGADGVAPALAFPVGMGAGWAYQICDSRLRQGRAALGGRLAEDISRGAPRAFEKAIAASLGRQVLATAAFLALALVLRPALSWTWARAPRLAQDGLGFALDMAPWIGGATLAQSLWPQ